jgi:hypothetical protein
MLFVVLMTFIIIVHNPLYHRNSKDGSFEKEIFVATINLAMAGLGINKIKIILKALMFEKAP